MYATIVRCSICPGNANQSASVGVHRILLHWMKPHPLAHLGVAKTHIPARFLRCSSWKFYIGSLVAKHSICAHVHVKWIRVWYSFLSIGLLVFCQLKPKGSSRGMHSSPRSASNLASNWCASVDLTIRLHAIQNKFAVGKINKAGMLSAALRTRTRLVAWHIATPSISRSGNRMESLI